MLPLRRIDPRSCRNERGIALITVMLVVALATMLAVSMMRSQHLSLRYSGGVFSQDQAMLYTQGAEAFVQDLLTRDLEEDKRQKLLTDHPGESWARTFPPFPVEGGMVQARLTDLQGRFNLNLLLRDNGVDASAQSYFKRLLSNLDQPDNLDAALIDWMDTDNEPTGIDGAEDDHYTRLPVPYRTANQPLTDISELLLIKGFTPAIVERLRPFVSALPATAGLNVNTAPSELIQALTENMTLSGADEQARQRPADGYESVDQFLGSTAFNGMDTKDKEAIKAWLSVKTGYFGLDADASISGRHSVLHAVIARGDSGTLRIVSRDYSRHFQAAAVVEKSSGTTATEMP